MSYKYKIYTDTQKGVFVYFLLVKNRATITCEEAVQYGLPDLTVKQGNDY